MNDIIKLFFEAIGMLASDEKSCIYCAEGDDEQFRDLAALFNLKRAPLQVGLTYLGFIMKTLNYTVEDWSWLIIKYRNKLNIWSTKWLSRGGRLILVKVVLQQITVYWAYLYILPNKNLRKIKKIMANFIWGGGRDKRAIHLVKWDCLTIPIESGGWGILDMEVFGNSLIIKSLWRCLQGKGKWHEIINQKYLAGVSVEEMVISGWKVCRCRSFIWNGFGKLWYIIRENMKWYFGNGSKILIGNKMMLGLEEHQHLLAQLFHILNQRGVFFL